MCDYDALLKVAVGGKVMVLHKAQQLPGTSQDSYERLHLLSHLSKKILDQALGLVSHPGAQEGRTWRVENTDWKM